MKTESPCSIASPCLLDKSSRKRPVSDLVASVEERGSLQMLKGFDRDDEVVSVRLQQPTTICNIQSVAGISVMGSSPLNVNKPNQDALIMFEDEKTQSLVIACLDGHGVNGHLIAQFFKREITARLPIHPLFATNLEVAISEVLFVLEYELYRKEQRLADFSGTTLTLAVIRNGKVTVANIGDSRIILARHASHYEENRMATNSVDVEDDDSSSSEPSAKRLCRELTAKPLTMDHKPDCPLEYQRILTTGGRVFSVRYEDGCVGPARVWLSNMNVPGLAMSRSLGDFIVHTAGVISKPDFYEYTLQPDEDVFLIAATDGLWDHVSNQDAMKIVTGADNGAVEAVQLLWKESRSRWLTKERVVDDTTICVVHFQKQAPPSPNPQE